MASSNLSSPEVFSLANQSLKLTTADDITPHLAPLTSSTTITTLHLSGNTFGPTACEALASVLVQKKTLQTALLSDIFTSRLLSEIPPALSSLLTALLELPNLHTVDLSDNAFGLNTVGPLVEFLSKSTPLKHLILQNNGLGPHAGTQIAEALTNLSVRKAEARTAGKEVPELETIVCGRNRLESGSMPAWAKMFEANKNVKVVKMVQNGIRQDGISLLLRQGLGRCKGLETLDLQDNTFTSTGATALADEISKWPSLRELGVGDSLLGSRGTRLLATALGNGGNKNLEVLRAQYNEIDARSIRALWRAAEKALPKLRRVEINGNRFEEGDDGVEGLRELLEGRREVPGEGEWGLDELSDLEEASEDEGDEVEGAEDEGREEEEEAEQTRERVLKDAQQEEEQNVAEKKDEDVDALADRLGKTRVE